MSSAQHLINRLSESLRKGEQKKNFETIDRVKISKYTDKELAAWQSDFDPDSPHFILAEYEWSRRLTAKQISATKFASVTGIIGVVIGVLLTNISGRISQSQSGTQSICQQCLEKSESSTIENQYPQNSSLTSTNKNISNQILDPTWTTPVLKAKSVSQAGQD